MHLIFDFIIMMDLVAIIVAHQKSLSVMELKEKTANFKEIIVSMDFILVMKFKKIDFIILQSFTTITNSTNLLHLNFTVMIGKTNYYLYSIMMIKITTFHLEDSTVGIKITISTEFAIEIKIPENLSFATTNHH